MDSGEAGLDVPLDAAQGCVAGLAMMTLAEVLASPRWVAEECRSWCSRIKDKADWPVR